MKKTADLEEFITKNPDFDKKAQSFLKSKNFLYISQQRFSSPESIPGKFFHEAKNWAKYFKTVIFVGHCDQNEFIFKREGNFFIFGVPFDLSTSASDSVVKILRNYIRLSLVILRITRIFKIDLIREGNLILVGLPTLIAAKIRNIPFFCWLGGYERKAFAHQYRTSKSLVLLNKMIIGLEYLILRNSDMNITVSQELFGLIKERKGKRRYLSPNYVDLSIFTPKTEYKIDPQKVKLFFSCRMEREKGLGTLLKSVNILAKRNSKFELNLVGYGSMRPWIEQYIVDNHLQNYVHLLGKFRLADLPKIYHDSDIFVIPSYTEGLPAALLESMATGCPCVSTNVGMISNYIVPNVSGILVPPGNPKALADALESLIQHPENISLYGKHARKILEEKSDYVKVNSILYYIMIQSHNHKRKI